MFAHRLRIVVTACLLSLVSPPAGSTAADSGEKPARASLVLVNSTDRPIYVYVDGQYVTRCEAGLRTTVDCTPLGDVTGVGRFCCDTWGPRRLTLRAGSKTEWEFREPAKTGRSATASADGEE